jgi:hypothetical protein
LSRTTAATPTPGFAVTRIAVGTVVSVAVTACSFAVGPSTVDIVILNSDAEGSHVGFGSSLDLGHSWPTSRSRPPLSISRSSI